MSLKSCAQLWLGQWLLLQFQSSSSITFNVTLISTWNCYSQQNCRHNNITNSLILNLFWVSACLTFSTTIHVIKTNACDLIFRYAVWPKATLWGFLGNYTQKKKVMLLYSKIFSRTNPSALYSTRLVNLLIRTPRGATENTPIKCVICLKGGILAMHWVPPHRSSNTNSTLTTWVTGNKIGV